MLQFTCDICSRVIQNERYEAKVEIAATFDPDELIEADLDSDHLAAIADSLAEMEDAGGFDADDSGTQVFRFDLCPHCMRRYAKDPLGRESLRRLSFSQN